MTIGGICVGDFNVMPLSGRQLLEYRLSEIDTSVGDVYFLPTNLSSDMDETHRAKCLQNLQLVTISWKSPR